MNKEKKFLEYLKGLETEGNAELLESISEGFKTLVEYRVNGSVSERSVNIMESEMTDDVIAEDPESVEENKLGDLDTPLDEGTVAVKSRIYGKNSDQAGHAKYVEDQKKGVAAGIKAAGDKNREAFASLNEEGDSDEGGVSEEENVIMEVGEGDIKGNLTPALLRKVDDTVEEKIRKMSDMIERQKLVSNDEQKIKYLNHMRGQLWRDELLSHGVNPEQAKGLMPAMNESVEEADNKLLDFIDSAFKLFQIDKPE